MSQRNTHSPRDLKDSNPGYFGKLLLLLLACALVNGCAKSPPPIYRDPCLDDGPANSAEYGRCIADREARKSATLEELLSDKPSYQKMGIASEVVDGFQPGDFPETSSNARYRFAHSISMIEKQNLPFKIRIIWKYTSRFDMPALQDRVRMDRMEGLIMPAVKDKGLAKWICTVTSEQKQIWTFYTQSDEAFITRVQSSLALTGPYPIEFSAHKEPAWSPDIFNDQQEVRITPKRCVE
ncbi:DUF695 domain-containing protein [Pseudomonas cichorii]|nr:DUF695 domain-containing protein [Pseudomonas cichorii]MBX8509111.1 DUF695 domain-containing protein [Pseudomonas cichorii]MBX8524674.1 DUF695 domain-containing protein [Pseudomonas cichorii]MBX8569060.1 DUF695 domain-containing protein [Pseudomonas cichorii]